MMDDYIRKAVELADGFSVTAEGFTRDFDESGYDFIHFYIDEPELAKELQLGLDALAAQLVRQVDARSDAYVESCDDESIVWLDGMCEGDAAGKDRTMNTIKAIIDSGVLE